LIKLTRLDGQPFVLNAELIRTVEATPDTVVTLVDGSRVIVAETPAELVRRVIAYRQAISGRSRMRKGATGHEE